MSPYVTLKAKSAFTKCWVAKKLAGNVTAATGNVEGVMESLRDRILDIKAPAIKNSKALVELLITNPTFGQALNKASNVVVQQVGEESSGMLDKMRGKRITTILTTIDLESFELRDEVQARFREMLKDTGISAADVDGVFEAFKKLPVSAFSEPANLLTKLAAGTANEDVKSVINGLAKDMETEGALKTGAKEGATKLANEVADAAEKAFRALT